MSSEMLLVAYYGDGWCVVVMTPNETPQIVSGPHRDHTDAVLAAEVRAYRIRRGWAVRALQRRQTKLFSQIEKLDAQVDLYEHEIELLHTSAAVTDPNAAHNLPSADKPDPATLADNDDIAWSPPWEDGK